MAMLNTQMVNPLKGSSFLKRPRRSGLRGGDGQLRQEQQASSVALARRSETSPWRKVVDSAMKHGDFPSLYRIYPYIPIKNMVILYEKWWVKSSSLC